MKKVLIFSLLLSLSALPLKAVAANSSDVIINELAWMGTTTSANDEWLELYNTANNPITLDGWVLKAADGTPDIKLAGTIPANDFYLLERTDDNTVPDIVADQIYTGAMGNNGEDLTLYDNSNNLIDEANNSGGWLAGDNSTKQTMEKTSNRWQTSENPGGTPKSQNSTGIIAKVEPIPIEEKITEAPAEEKPAESRTPLTYPTGVVLNELLPSPEGADGDYEWIVATMRLIPSACS